MDHHEELADLFSLAVKVLMLVLKAQLLVVTALLRDRYEPWKLVP